MHRAMSRFRVTTGVLVLMALVACNGATDTMGDTKGGTPTAVVPEHSTPSITQVPPDTTANEAPQINGTPSSNAIVGQDYSFQPAAADHDGDKLTFSISNKPAWASFDPATGRLWGRPDTTDIGVHEQIAINVSDGAHTRALPQFTVKVVGARKSNYGHYFATHYSDSPSDAAMLCQQPGVNGVVWRQTWNQVEPKAGVYNFSSFDKVLGAIANSRNPQCQLWLFVEFKSFRNSPVKNPCPQYLQARHSGPNTNGRNAATCFMWEPEVRSAYVAMMRAAAARFDHNPRVEGLVIQESSLGFNDRYSQDVGDGGTYTPAAWRDALITIIQQCADAFATSRCVSFLNFIRGGQSYLNDISAAIAAVPNNQVCFSGPDLLPNAPSLYEGRDSVYQVLNRHPGCRSNSAQNDSYEVPGCTLGCIFHFAVGGTMGNFPEHAPLSGGLCVNSYIFWNDKTIRRRRGQDWKDALPVIAANPYGANWYKHCAGSDGRP